MSSGCWRRLGDRVEPLENGEIESLGLAMTMDALTAPRGVNRAAFADFRVWCRKLLEAASRAERRASAYVCSTLLHLTVQVTTYAAYRNRQGSSSSDREFFLPVYKVRESFVAEAQRELGIPA